jgi:hypothetical protein
MRTYRKRPTPTVFLCSLLGLAACNQNWRDKAMTDAEALIRDELKSAPVTFTRVQFTGDDRSGQTCGYYETPTSDGGTESTRFIVFVDGAGRQNPFIDDPSAPYPKNKDDFALNWRTQCLDLGYKE